MIESIQIKNIALIEDLTVYFHQGLNILTGETGSGKSVLFQSILFALGERFDFSFFKDLKKTAFVIIQFRLSEERNYLIEYLRHLGISTEDNMLIIKREYGIDQKIRSFVNYQVFPVHYIKKIASMMLDFLSQHSNQSLLKVKNHRQFLDSFAHLNERVLIFKKYFHEYKKALEDYREFKQNKKELRWAYQERKRILQAIRKLKIKENEDEYLENLIKKYSQMEVISQNLNLAYQDFYQKENSIISLMERWLINFEKLIPYDKSWEEPLNDLKSAFFLMQNIHEYLRVNRSNFSYSEDSLDEMNERLYQINKWKRKYGPTLNDLFQYENKLENENKSFVERKQMSTDRKHNIKKLALFVKKEALAISKIRKKYARILEANIKNELDSLGMGRSNFNISLNFSQQKNESIDISNSDSEKSDILFNKKIKINEYGIDEIEFLFASDSNQNFKPLVKIASGGELSRVIIAIKSVLIKEDPVQILILDEVDSGIGGAIALALAEVIDKLSHNCQVICITHLPQIAVKAKHHFRIEKNYSMEESFDKILVSYLNESDRVEEIARMLSGKITERSIQHAKELLKINN